MNGSSTVTGANQLHGGTEKQHTILTYPVLPVLPIRVLHPTAQEKLMRELLAPRREAKAARGTRNSRGMEDGRFVTAVTKEQM